MYINIIIKFMQDTSKVLYKAIGKVLSNKRKEIGVKYTDFCYENDIPMSTYDVIIKGDAQSSYFNIAKVVKALGLTFEEFGALLDKELPQDFTMTDN